MPDRLAVNPDGLRAACAELNDHAVQIVDANGAEPTGPKPSTMGAANVSAAIAAFTQEYASRLANHGQSTGAAANSYAIVDDDDAANISAVSL
ncbi:MAG: hypothetical protein QOJ20_5284 [Mycobacterium sp.]|jgi:hypothetical protein|nr:hypothetical protein [Mycobacterium sp.]